MSNTDYYYTGLINKYRARLPLAADVKPITLYEGNTPLIPLINIPRALNYDVDLYVKYEGLNPTGSFKDRGMTVAVTQAVAEGNQAIICASTGNTSAAAAAYGARAGIKVVVLIPQGKIALGKLAQALMHGAQVIQIDGNFDEALSLVKELVQHNPIAIVNSVNPFRLEGQKTAAFEVVEQLGQAPDYHALPVGNAGNISAYWMGYTEYYAEQICTRRPTMLGYQATGAAPFIHGGPIAKPETVATAIRIGNPQSWDKAHKAVAESQGWFADLSDEQILQTQQLLASQEGIFCEPASAASLAGVLADIQTGKIAAGKSIVCTLTGHGLKDPDIAIARTKDNIHMVAPELAKLKDIIFKN
ncbi:MAG: threonine synthase [Gammaproteobacteria bacterium]